MPINYQDSIAVLEGGCAIGEAEGLLAFLRGTKDATVEIGGLTHAHTAVLQVIVAVKPRVLGASGGKVVQACLSGLRSGL